METQVFIAAVLFVALISVMGLAITSTAAKVKELEKTVVLNQHKCRTRPDRSQRGLVVDFNAKDRQRLEDIIEQKSSEINELKCELTKVKFDYACEVAGGKREEKDQDEKLLKDIFEWLSDTEENPEDITGVQLYEKLLNRLKGKNIDRADAILD